MKFGVDVVEPLRGCAAGGDETFEAGAGGDEADEQVWLKSRWEGIVSQVEDVEEQEERIAIFILQVDFSWLRKFFISWCRRWWRETARRCQKAAEDGARNGERVGRDSDADTALVSGRCDDEAQ